MLHMQKDGNEFKDSVENDIPIKDSEENDFEIEDIEKNNSDLKTICKYCLQPIKSGAKICRYCGKYQSIFYRLPYYFATLAIPLAVVIFAGLQVHFNILQYEEAKAKRVEAEQVLKKAEAVLVDTKNKSEEIRKKAETTLSDAKETLETASKVSTEAKAEANKVLALTRNESKAVIEKANEARKGFDKASNEVKLSLQESSERIALVENNFWENLNNLTLEIEDVKNDLSSELVVLKERNQLVSLADVAINKGERDALDELRRIAFNENESPSKQSIAFAEMLRVKAQYISISRLRHFEIKITNSDQSITTDNDIPTDVLIRGLLENKNWGIRGRAAQLLANRKEKEVPKALIQSIKKEKRLDNLKESLEAFASVTGYKKRDVFDTQPVIEWWEENEKKVESELSEKE